MERINLRKGDFTVRIKIQKALVRSERGTPVQAGGDLWQADVRELTAGSSHWGVWEFQAPLQKVYDYANGLRAKGYRDVSY